jgi:hypothetical protein
MLDTHQVGHGTVSESNPRHRKSITVPSVGLRHTVAFHLTRRLPHGCDCVAVCFRSSPVLAEQQYAPRRPHSVDRRAVHSSHGMHARPGAQQHATKTQCCHTSARTLTPPHPKAHQTHAPNAAVRVMGRFHRVRTRSTIISVNQHQSVFLSRSMGQSHKATKYNRQQSECWWS